MADQKREKNAPHRIYPRESEDPIAGEYREDLLQKPSFASQSARRLANDEDKLARIEGLQEELLKKLDALERRVQNLEGEIRK